MEKRISAALRIWEDVQRKSQTLDLLKGELRKKALDLDPTPGSRVFEGEGLTQARVVVPSPKMVLKKGANPGLHQAVFGKAFPLLFQEERSWTLRNPEMAASLVQRLPRAAQTTSFFLLEESESKPRVYFEGSDKVEALK